MLGRDKDPPEDDEIVLSTIVVEAGNNCNEYTGLFKAKKVLLLVLPWLCPTCLQPTLVLNGYYRNRQVKTTSPVGEVPGEYPEPVERIDLHKLHCTNPKCEQPYHTVLPSFLAPYLQYVHSVRQTVIEAVDNGATVYSLASKLRLFPYLIHRWTREGEELAGLIVGPVLAKVQEMRPGSVVAAASEKSVSMWRCLVSAVLVLVMVLYRDPDVRWSEDRLLEFVYLLCSERRELRFWDRQGRRRKESLHPITVALPVPDPG